MLAFKRCPQAGLCDQKLIRKSLGKGNFLRCAGRFLKRRFRVSGHWATARAGARPHVQRQGLRIWSPGCVYKIKIRITYGNRSQTQSQLWTAFSPLTSGDDNPWSNSGVSKLQLHLHFFRRAICEASTSCRATAILPACMHACMQKRNSVDADGVVTAHAPTSQISHLSVGR